MDLGSIKIDSAKREQGEWVDQIPEMGDLRLLVRGVDNASYQKMFGELARAIPGARRPRGRVDPVELDKIVTACLTETVLRGWENVWIGGVAVPYSIEKAREIMSDPDFRAFRDAVFWAGDVIGKDAAENKTAAGKNS